MINNRKNQQQKLKSLFSQVGAIAATTCLLSVSAQSAYAGGLTNGSTFMLFLECNNDGIFHVIDDSLNVNGWQYTADARGDNTDGGLYDMGGIAIKQTGNEVFVAITGGTPLEGAGYDRNVDKIFHGDLLFTPGSTNFQNAMETGDLYGVHFTGSQDSGADSGLGVYKNVAAKSVGAKNFGHSSHTNYGNIVDSNVDNFFGGLGLENDYFNKDKGYNAIAEGTKVENDGFKLLDDSQLQKAGFDAQQFGGEDDFTFGFKFDLATILPPREPKGIGVLQGVAGEAGVEWNQEWDGEIGSFDTKINEFETEANKQQGIADTKQQEADYYQAISDKAEDERKKIQRGEINPRSKVNNTAIQTSPGGSGYLEAKGVRDRREDLEEEIGDAQKVIDNNPGKIATAEQELNVAEKALKVVPSEEDYISNKRDNADNGVKDAYAALEDLTPEKETWEQYKEDQGYDKPWKWNRLSLEEKLAVQESFPGDWVALRQDGSASKQEQELEAFTKQVENFENSAKQERTKEINGYNNTINRRSQDIEKYETEIDDAKDDKQLAERQLDDLYDNAEDDLLQDLRNIKQNASSALNDLATDNNLTDAQKQEREEFYQAEIAEIQEQIDYIKGEGDLDTILDYLGNPKNNRGYYKQELQTAIKLDDRRVLDENGKPEVYTADDFQVEVPVYDAEGNQVGTETKDIAVKEYYYDDRGRLKSRSVDLVGQPKTVNSEYQRLQGEISAYGNVRNNNNEGLKKISNDAKTANNNAIAEKNDALAGKQAALREKDRQIEAKSDRLLGIEDEIVAAKNQTIMAERLKATEKAEAEEKALEEKYGVRAENNQIPLTAEEVEEYNQAVREVEESEENRAYVPEPGSIVGLLAVGLGLVGSQLRKLRK